jgi:hypothetical protein
MWQKYKLETNKIFEGKIGYRKFWICKIDLVWNIAVQVSEGPESTQTPKEVEKLPQSVQWSHLIADVHQTVLIMPAMPDRPVVIKPEKSFTLLPGISLDILIRIPVWVQIYASRVKEHQLMIDFPSRQISSTWFGDPDNGEIAYSLSDPAYFLSSDLVADDDHAICPVKIKNESDTILNFQRLSVPANQLNIYSDKGKLFTNEVRVRFKGEEQQTDLQIMNGSPEIAQGYPLLSHSRLKPNKNILRKSFYFLKSITDY